MVNAKKSLKKARANRAVSDTIRRAPNKLAQKLGRLLYGNF